MQQIEHTEVQKGSEAPSKTVCTVGLGAPPTEAFFHHLKATSYRRTQETVDELNSAMEGKENLIATTDPAQIEQANIVITHVSTLVMKNKHPDFHPILGATNTTWTPLNFEFKWQIDDVVDLLNIFNT